MAFAHGASRTKREFALHFGYDAPTANGESVPVWVRDDAGKVRRSALRDARVKKDAVA